MNEMDRSNVIYWLNRMVAMIKLIRESVSLSNGLEVDSYTQFMPTTSATNFGMQIGSDVIDFVAEAVGQTVEERNFDDEYIARYFIYDGVDVFALVDKEEVA